MELPSLTEPDLLAPIQSRILACLIDLSIGVVALLLAKFILSNSPGNVLSILGAFVSVAIDWGDYLSGRIVIHNGAERWKKSDGITRGYIFWR